jgi:hypothetical protein
MKALDLTAEITALRDQVIQPREVAELFYLATGREEFKRCQTYNQIYDVLEALSYI